MTDYLAPMTDEESPKVELAAAERVAREKLTDEEQVALATTIASALDVAGVANLEELGAKLGRAPSLVYAELAYLALAPKEGRRQ